MWIDSTNQIVLKIRLQSEFGRNSPFIAVGNAEKIATIRFDITKNFKLLSRINTIQSIDFNYTLNYLRKDKQKVTVETKAVLFAYDYTSEFVLPSFDKTYKVNDYQEISLAPYSFSFWESNSEFKLLAKESEKRLFIENNTTNLIDSFSYDPVSK